MPSTQEPQRLLVGKASGSQKKLIYVALDDCNNPNGR